MSRQLKIDFDKRINQETFERILRKRYKNSCNTNGKIIFNFSLVEWFTLTELCSITLWIFNLISIEKKIEVISPHSLKVDSFLERWNFYKFLDAHSITYNDIKGKIAKEEIEFNEENNCIEGITFFYSRKYFNQYIEKLGDKAGQESLFGDLYTLEIIGSGGFRDIILHEIGNNFFDHAAGKGALISMIHMHELKANEKYSAENKSSLRIQSSIEPEKKFFQTLGTGGYLCIILSDLGPGITFTLGDEYRKLKNESSDVGKEKNNFEHNVLDYAFEKFSTSKKVKPLSEIASEEDYESLVPPRGLYFVKKIIKENRGFLSVRSGKSIIYYDFLNNQNYGYHYTDASLNRVGELEFFEGVQYKIYIPVSIRKKHESLKLNFEISTSHKEYDIISALMFLTNGDFDINSFFDLIKRQVIENKNKKIIAIDFTGCDLQKNYLYPVIKKIMHLQQTNQLICLYNIEESKSLVDILSDCIINEYNYGFLREHFIIHITKDFEKKFIGISDKIINELATLSQKNNLKLADIKSDKMVEFIKAGDHYFRILPDDSISEDYSEINFKISLLKHYSEQLIKIIVDKKNRIHQDGKFLIPSIAYTTEFFEINNILINPRYFEILIKYLKLLVELHYPTLRIIVTWSNITNKIIAKLINEINDVKKPYKIIHININYKEDLLISKFLDYQDFGENSILLFTDVVGSGKSIKRIINILQNSIGKLVDNTIMIYCMIDARDKKEAETSTNNKKIDGITNNYLTHNPLSGLPPFSYKVFFLYRHPIEYWREDKPQTWDLKDVSVISPESHTPIRAREDIESVTELEKFLKDYCYGSLLTGHLLFNEFHYNYFFLSDRIMRIYDHKFFQKIEQFLNDYWKKAMHAEEKVTLDIKYILYNEKSLVEKTTIRKIASMLNLSPSNNVKSISELSSESSKELDNLSNKDIIYIDHASSTGKTLMEILNIISGKHGARRIFALILISRLDDTRLRFFQNIRTLNSTDLHVKYLFDMELPRFIADVDCPLCNRRKRLIRLREIYKINSLSPIISERVESLKEVPISEFIDRNEDIPNKDQVLSKVITRIQLEKSKYFSNAEIRKQTITKFIKEFDDNQSNDSTKEKIENILEILSEEEDYFRNEEQNILYGEHKSSLEKICLIIIENPTDYNFNIVLSALRVLRIYYTEAFRAKIVIILKHLSHHNIKDGFLQDILLEIVIYIDNIISFHNERNEILTEIHDALLQSKNVLQDLYFSYNKHNYLKTALISINEILQMLKIYNRKKMINEKEEVYEKIKLLYYKINSSIKELRHTPMEQFFTPLNNATFKTFKKCYENNYSEPKTLKDNLNDILNVMPDLIPYFQDALDSESDYFLSNQYRNDIIDLDSFLYELYLDKELTQIKFKEKFESTQKTLIFSRILENIVSENDNLFRKFFDRIFPNLKLTIEKEISDLKPDIYFFFEHHNLEELDIFMPEEKLRNLIYSQIRNVIEYAFLPIKSYQSKECYIKIDQNANGVILIIKDNGEGTSKEILLGNSHGGNRLANELIEKYFGEFNINESNKGTEIQLTFVPKEKIV